MPQAPISQSLGVVRAFKDALELFRDLGLRFKHGSSEFWGDVNRRPARRLHPWPCDLVLVEWGPPSDLCP